MGFSEFTIKYITFLCAYMAVHVLENYTDKNLYPKNLHASDRPTSAYVN